MVGIFKKTAFLVVLFAMLEAKSAEPAKQRVAVVDLQTVMQQASAVKSIEDQFHKLESDMQAKYKNKEDNYNKEKEKLLEKKSAMSEKAHKEEMEKIDQKIAESQNDLNYESNIAYKARYNSIMTLQDKVVEVITGLAKKYSLNFILPKSVALYSDNEITNEVVEKLNKTIPNIDLDLNAVKKEYENNTINDGTPK